MSSPIPPHLVAILRRYGKACEAYSWRGSQPPEDIPEIERELERAWTATCAAIAKAISKGE